MSLTDDLQIIKENIPKVFESGYQEGNADGEAKGYSSGYQAGHTEGYEKGNADGETKGYSSGYQAGHQQGFTDGKTEGIEEGRNTEESDFWDAYQNNGDRVDYNGAFAGNGWNGATFRPKYDIKPLSMSRMFFSSGITNLKALLEDVGVTLDTSSCGGGANIFEGSTITHIGVIDMTKMPNINYFFYQATALVSIDKVILKADGSQTFASTTSFGGCANLTHMPIEGVIGQNNFNVQWSDLDTESLISILNALQDKTSNTSGTEWKIKIGETNLAKLTEDNLKIAYDKGWGVE